MGMGKRRIKLQNIEMVKLEVIVNIGRIKSDTIN